MNSTVKQVENQKIYLQNSVVCLQDNWWNAFSFIGTSFTKSIKFALSFISNDQERKTGINYQCENPFVKLKYAKSQLATQFVDMPQFEVDSETLFKLEVFLSPERFQSKRDTLNMVQLLQAYGAFRGAMTLIGLSIVASFAANNYQNEMAKSFITEGGSST